MVLQAVKMMYDNRREGDLLMDAPVTSDWDELRSMASAEKGKTWQQLVRQIKDVVSIQATKSGSKKGGGKKRKSSKKRNGKQKKKKVSDGEKEGKEEMPADAAAAKGDDGGESSEDDDWVIKKRVYKKVQPPIRCKDGFQMSVQASRDHYCTPRDDKGPYTHVEVGWPSMWEDLLLPFTDNDTDRTPVVCGESPTLYVNVPANTVRAVVEKHGGMSCHSGKLPRMEETDEDGYLWAAAAEPPTDSETEETESTDRTDPAAELFISVMHMGAPPPPPPPLPPTQIPPPTTDALTPPPALANTTISPITTTTHEDFEFFE